jgi:rubrerythrin
MTDAEFTKDWWRRCLADNTKLTLWLQKLQRTEISGYWDHKEYLAQADVGIIKISDRERMILTNIAEDEKKHSDILVQLFEERGIAVVPNGPDSTYWEDMLADVPTFAHYCAANYFGEALAAFRFEIIAEMPETPEDIKSFIRKALPDEIFHRETLQRLAGEEVLAEMKKRHDDAYNRLVNKK